MTDWRRHESDRNGSRVSLEGDRSAWFQVRQYENAFPQILILGCMGFKDAQARVSYIYLHGLGGQKKSNMEEIGWLGVATTGVTRLAYRNLFKQVIAQIPSEHLEAVNTHV